jgi:hypothetical protein
MLLLATHVTVPASPRCCPIRRASIRPCDMQREKLASQLGELEATERVLARYSKCTQLKQTASARTSVTATKAAAPARRRGRPPTTTAKAVGGKRSSSNLADQVLALATGKTQQEIAAACKGARPAPPFPATSGRAASKSAMGNSTPYSQRVRSNRLRSDTGIVGPERFRAGHRWDSSPKIRFAQDSPLEGTGFEPSVPRERLVPELCAAGACMPPEHAITTLPGVPGLISLSCGAHLSAAAWTCFGGGAGVDLEFFFIAPIPPVDSSIG